jgi:hypothetical protein
MDGEHETGEPQRLGDAERARRSKPGRGSLKTS